MNTIKRVEFNEQGMLQSVEFDVAVSPERAADVCRKLTSLHGLQKTAQTVMAGDDVNASLFGSKPFERAVQNVVSKAFKEATEALSPDYRRQMLGS